MKEYADKRLGDEHKLLDALKLVPDLQTAWQLLVQCAGPRCNHLLRTLPPSQAQGYAAAHDEAMWNAAQELLGRPHGTTEELHLARLLATLPLRLGGLGLRSAGRTSDGAYWGS